MKQRTVTKREIKRDNFCSHKVRTAITIGGAIEKEIDSMYMQN